LKKRAQLTLWDEQVLLGVFCSAHPEGPSEVSNVQPRQQLTPAWHVGSVPGLGQGKVLPCVASHHQQTWFGAGEGAALCSIASLANLLHASDPQGKR